MSFFRTISQSNQDGNPQSLLVKKLRNSPYYNMYKKTFDYIISKMPQDGYKIEWLLDYLDDGGRLDIQWSSIPEERALQQILPYEPIVGSIEHNLPYYCVNEDEYEYLTSAYSLNTVSNNKYGGISAITLAQKGDPLTIAELASRYSEKWGGKTRSPRIFNYWKSQLIGKAELGDRMAQGILCGKNYPSFYIVSPEERTYYEGLYLNNLTEASESGNLYARQAIARFICADEDERLKLLTTCTRDGNRSDAWLDLSSYYDSLVFADERKGIIHTEEEKQQIYRMKVLCALRAAEANNGIGATTCQKWVSDLYRDGDYFLPLDMAKSQYFAQLARQNGADRI